MGRVLGWSALLVAFAVFGASDLVGENPKHTSSRAFLTPQGKSCLVTFLSKSDREDEVAVTLASCLPHREGSGGVELTDSSQEVYRSNAVIVSEKQLKVDANDIPAAEDLAIVLFPSGTASALAVTPRLPSSNNDLKPGDAFPLEVSAHSLPGTPVFDHKGKILSLFRGGLDSAENKEKSSNLELVSLISEESIRLFGSAKRFDQYALSGVPSQQKAGSELGLFFNRCRQQCYTPQTTCNYYYTQPVCQPQCRPQVVVQPPAVQPQPVAYPVASNTNQNLNSNRNSNHLNSSITSSNTNHNHVAPVQTMDNHSTHTHNSPVNVNPRINVNPNINPNINVNPNITINIPPQIAQKLDQVDAVSRRLEQQERANASLHQEQARALQAAQAENAALTRKLELARHTSYVSTPTHSVQYTPPVQPVSYVAPVSYSQPSRVTAPRIESKPDFFPLPASVLQIPESKPKVEEAPKEPEPAPYVGLYETVSVEKKTGNSDLQKQVARNAKELSGNSDKNTAFVAKNESPFLRSSVIISHSDRLTLIARGETPQTSSTVVATRDKVPADQTITVVKK